MKIWFLGGAQAEEDSSDASVHVSVDEEQVDSTPSTSGDSSDASVHVSVEEEQVQAKMQELERKVEELERALAEGETVINGQEGYIAYLLGTIDQLRAKLAGTGK